jgi:dihydroorotate dehydrogenase (NAD+) catalytic subunit
MINLSIKIGKIKLKNPVLVASGVFGYGVELKDLVDLKKIGAIITKTITLKPKEGNPPPRIYETPSGMLNSIGLENPGLDIFIREKLPFLKKIGIPVIVSISGDSIEEFVELAKKLDREIEAIELNISCPNIKRTKLIAQDSKATSHVVKSVRKVTGKTLITKLSPNVTDITEIAKAAVEAGTDAISLINTIFGMAVDIKKKRIMFGGLSGPAIKPIALRMVYEVRRKVDIPIIGCGGIMNWQDALEFLICGATAVAIGTANLINPKISIEIIKGIENYLKKNKIRNIKELRW